MKSRLSKTPLYRQIEACLRERFLTRPEPGMRLPPENELASDMGVSIPTLRKAVETLVKEGQLIRRQGSGTFVLAEPEEQQKPLVAILCHLDLSRIPYSFVQSRPLYQCQQLLRRAGYRARVYLGDAPEFLEDVAAGEVAAVAALDILPSPKWQSPLDQRQIPVVGIGELHRNMVTGNFTTYIIEAANRLLAKGRRKVAYLGGKAFHGHLNNFSYQGPSEVWSDQTLRTLLDGLGLEVHDHWYNTEWSGDTTGAGWSALRELWSRPERPEGLILNGSTFSHDVLLAASQTGIRIPDDLCIVQGWLKDAPTAPDEMLETLYYDTEPMITNLVEMLDEAIRTGSIARPRRIVEIWETRPRTRKSSPARSAARQTAGIA